jgi:serine/threonine protein kinase
MKVISDKMDRQVMTLKKTGSTIIHHLISKQYRTYFDDFRVYFLSRWVEGEDLYTLIEKQKKLSLKIVRHFTACILSIMEYLHCRRIVWR